MTANKTNDVSASSPVGVFDSGVGGLTVLRELTRILPCEDFIYYGDVKNAPYGALSHDEIRRRSLEIAGELIGMGAKAIVVACNTATAAAVEAMRAAYPQIPIIGTEPAVKPAADAGHRHILVLATPVTVAEERFSALIHSRCGTAEVIAVPCPGLATMIEEGHTSDGVLCEYLDGIFAPLRGKFDAVVLGCTHYPLARTAISRAAGGDVPVYDGAAGTARQAARRLSESGLGAPGDKHGSVRFLSSGDAGKIKAFYEGICHEA